MVRVPSVWLSCPLCSVPRLSQELFTLHQPPSGGVTESLEGGQELAQAKHRDLLAYALGPAPGTWALS